MATIKKFILLSLTALMMTGCAQTNEPKRTIRVDGVSVSTIDSCEYVLGTISGYSSGIIPIHKGNCRFCEERREKKIKELVELLKDK